MTLFDLINYDISLAICMFFYRSNSNIAFDEHECKWALDYLNSLKGNLVAWTIAVIPSGDVPSLNYDP
jgi:hypothetical protein